MWSINVERGECVVKGIFAVPYPLSIIGLTCLLFKVHLWWNLMICWFIALVCDSCHLSTKPGSWIIIPWSCNHRSPHYPIMLLHWCDVTLHIMLWPLCLASPCSNRSLQFLLHAWELHLFSSISFLHLHMKEEILIKCCRQRPGCTWLSGHNTKFVSNAIITIVIQKN